MPVGAREPLDTESISARISRTGDHARIDDYTKVHGRVSESALAKVPVSASAVDCCDRFPTVLATSGSKISVDSVREIPQSVIISTEASKRATR